MVGIGRVIAVSFMTLAMKVLSIRLLQKRAPGSRPRPQARPTRTAPPPASPVCHPSSAPATADPAPRRVAEAGRDGRSEVLK